MKAYSYETQGVCSSRIEVQVEGDIIRQVDFINGCPGNLTGISKLVKGMEVEKVIGLLKGTDCRGKGTSCPDQLAAALEGIRAKR